MVRSVHSTVVGASGAPPAAFEGDVGSRLEPELRAERDFLAALAELLTHAQRGGGIRDDIDAADVRALVVGSVMMERIRGDVDAPGRMIALVSDTLSADRPAATPPALVVTKLQSKADFHNEPARPELLRNETAETEAAKRCEICGKPVHATRQGRPARFCGAACRQKAYRRRHASGSAE